MRVTEQSIARTNLRNLERIRRDIGQRNQEMASGKKFSTPSDNPSVSAQRLSIRDEVSRVNQYYRNINAAQLRLGSTDDVLNSTRNRLSHVMARASFGLTGTLRQADRDAIAVELEEVLRELQRAVETRADNKSLFSGSQVQSNPVSFDGTTYSYDGDSEKLYVEITQGERLQVNVTADEVFLKPGSDMLNTLKGMIDQFRSGDLAQVKLSMEKIQASVGDLDAVRVRVGMALQRLETAKANHEDHLIRLTEQLSNLEDANMAETILSMNQSETALQVALAATQRSSTRPNLFDFLG